MNESRFALSLRLLTVMSFGALGSFGCGGGNDASATDGGATDSAANIAPDSADAAITNNADAASTIDTRANTDGAASPDMRITALDTAGVDMTSGAVDGGTTPATCAGEGQVIDGRCGLAFEKFSWRYQHGCGITASGQVYCVGSRDHVGHGDLPLSFDGSRPVRALLPAGVRAVELVTGQGFTCAVGDDTQLYCWGKVVTTVNSSNLGVDEIVTAPRVLPNAGRRFVKLAADLHICGIDSEAAVYCWHGGAGGWVGGTKGSGWVLTPTRVAGQDGLRFVDLQVRANRSCALTDTGIVYCWGADLGVGSAVSSDVPMRVLLPDSLKFKRVAPGRIHTCALATTGEVYCWGRNDVGVPTGGNPVSFTNQFTPLRVTMPAGFVPADIALTDDAACVLAADGRIGCWGRNNNGELGNGAFGSLSAPVPRDPVAVYVQDAPALGLRALTAADGGLCAIAASKLAYCWGGYGVNFFRSDTNALPPACPRGSSCIGRPTRLRGPQADVVRP